jgi:hypothetical protein
MVHVGVHSVGTYHKKFGKENKKNKNILCRVPQLGHSAKNALPSACRAALGKVFLKTLSLVFTECLSVGTRQILLCRMPDQGHSAKYIFLILKKSLPSARSRALDKDVKNIALPAPFFSFSFHSHIDARRAVFPERRHRRAVFPHAPGRHRRRHRRSAPTPPSPSTATATTTPPSPCRLPHTLGRQPPPVATATPPLPRRLLPRARPAAATGRPPRARPAAVRPPTSPTRSDRRPTTTVWQPPHAWTAAATKVM